MKVQTKTEEIAVVEKAPLVVTTKANVKEIFDLEMVENLPHGSRDNVHNQVVNDVAGGMNGRVRGGTANQTIFTPGRLRDARPVPHPEVVGGLRGQHRRLRRRQPDGRRRHHQPGDQVGLEQVRVRVQRHRRQQPAAASSATSRTRPAPTYFYVINPMFSGPIIKDKLWFHFNTESHIIQNGRDARRRGLSSPTPETYRKFIQKGTLKLTWQVNQPQQAAQR